MAAFAKLRFVASLSRRMYSKAGVINWKSQLPAAFNSEGLLYRQLKPIVEKEDDRDYTLEMILFLHRRYDFSWKGYKKWMKQKLEKAAEQDQRFIQQRLDILGPDLAAAHFIVHRGGAVKFKDTSMWIRKNDAGTYVLPRKYIPRLFIEAVDLFGVPIIHTGLRNLEDLSHCRWMNFRGCQNVDDFFMDWLGNYKDKLEYLDISNCPLLTERGVSSLARISCLKHLNVTNLVNMKNPKLVCLLLDDELPNCQIVGVDYMNPNHIQQSNNEEMVVVQPHQEQIKKLIT
ncbi:hypothetical protein CHUAL_009620 [Chamberlinius hualienensis]